MSVLVSFLSVSPKPKLKRFDWTIRSVQTFEFSSRIIRLPQLLISFVHLNVVDPKVPSQCIETALKILKDLTIFYRLQLEKITYKQYVIATHKCVTTRNLS
jgi:hypothetical protein